VDTKKKSVTKVDIEYLGSLAKISLTEDEKVHLSEELGKIIYYISQLADVPTEKISPTWHVLPVTNVFREDEIKDGTDREDILKNAPERTDKFFKVPKII